MSSCQVAVVGAGPYGLAAAATLREKGVDTHVLGEEMGYWKRMPRGMLLRSPRHASSIANPHGPLGLDAYEAASGNRLSSPLPLAGFVRYGEWVQRQVVPDLDRRRVLRIERDGSGFRLPITDGDELRATRVVVATGLTSYAYRPSEFSRLPTGVVSHTDELTEPRDLAGKRVLVVGGGQSAIESAALVHEAGGRVEVLVRTPQVRWLTRSGRMHRSRLRPLLYPDQDVGPIGLNQIAARPATFRRLPAGVRDPLAARCIRPAAADWLVERMADVPIVTGRRLTSASLAEAQLRVCLDDGSERMVDHILLGTGYRLDVRAHPLLAPSLVEELRTRDGYPRLRAGFESSVPGLHFVGAMSAESFGPVMRFVSGTWFAAPELALRIAEHAGRRRRKAAAPIPAPNRSAADASPPVP